MRPRMRSGKCDASVHVFVMYHTRAPSRARFPRSTLSPRIPVYIKASSKSGFPVWLVRGARVCVHVCRCTCDVAVPHRLR
jgi:hypothetical protein